MSDTTFDHVTIRLVHYTCWCGTPFAVPSEMVAFQQKQHDDGWAQTAIYCPHGHTVIRSGEGRAKVLERQIASERQRHDQTKAELRETEFRRRAQKAATTKIKKRIAGGACPCCNRTFQNLERHMKSQHPDFVEPSP